MHENLVSRDGFGRPAPRQPVHSPHSSRIWCLIGIPPDFRGGVHTFTQPYAIVSVSSYRVTQLRTDGVHCRESAGTGPVVPSSVVLDTGATFAGHHVSIGLLKITTIEHSVFSIQYSVFRCNGCHSEYIRTGWQSNTTLECEKKHQPAVCLIYCKYWIIEDNND